MNQKQQPRGRGNAPRQAPAQRQVDQPRTENQQIQEDQDAQARAQMLFREIRQRRGQIEAVLPPDVAYTKFEAALQMAIRREPRLLKCYLPSVIKAAIQSAYDGLLPDGNQAVILYSNNKVPGTAENGKRAEFRLEARYQSMVYGLRLKLAQAGAVTFIDAIVVFTKEPFRYVRGLQPVLEHEPILDPERRGDPIATYAVATLPDGTKVFDVLNKMEVMAARDVAKTKNVWDGPFGLEMWKKTAIRRLSKAVPTTRPIRDAEALEMYPQFAGVPPSAALPAPPRPDRRDFGAIEHREELPLDLSGFEGGYESEESRRATTEEPTQHNQKATDPPAGEQNAEGARARKGGQAMSSETSGSESDGSANAETGAGTGPNQKGEGAAAAASSPEPVIPETPEAWAQWAEILIAGLEKFATAKAVDDEARRLVRLIDAAPAELRKRVIGAMTERMTDLAADEAQPALAIEGE
jgi:phage RecT family recombinase